MAKKRTIVGYPLVPDLLRDMNLLQGFPETPADFDPNGQWTNTYRIMTCHGYREDGNEDIGLLRLSKSPDTDDTFRLKVEREIVNDEHRLHKYAAEIICRKDLAASPVSWRLSNQFTAPNQSDPRTLEEMGKANGTTAEITINNNRGRMVRTSRYKYIAYAKDEVDQLFDMREDPGETRNLSADSQYASVLKEHRERLIEWERQLVVAPDLKYANVWWRKG